MLDTRDLASLEPLSHGEASDVAAGLRRRAAASAKAARLALGQMQASVPATPEGRAREQIALAAALREAGRFTEAEYVFHTTCLVEQLRDARWFGGAYDGELAPIVAAMEAIEAAQGLEPDDYLGRDEAPPEWQALDARFEAALEARLAEAYEELGMAELWRLRSESPDRFEQLRETGRLALRKDEDAEEQVSNLIAVHEREARIAAAAGADLAAAMLLGRAMEGRLLLHCLRRPDAAANALARLPEAERPARSDPMAWSGDQLLAVARAGGWIHNLPYPELVAETERRLALMPLRPVGRQAADGVHDLLGAAAAGDAFAAYRALRLSLDLAACAQEPGATLQ